MSSLLPCCVFFLCIDVKADLTFFGEKDKTSLIDGIGNLTLHWAMGLELLLVLLPELLDLSPQVLKDDGAESLVVKVAIRSRSDEELGDSRDQDLDAIDGKRRV